MTTPQQQSRDDLRAALKNFLDALSEHPWFERESRARHGTIYYLWDFQLRTLKMLESYDGKSQEARSDIAGRCHLADILLNDTTGKRSMMTLEDPNNKPDFGKKVLDSHKEVLARLDNFAYKDS